MSELSNAQLERIVYLGEKAITVNSILKEIVLFGWSEEKKKELEKALGNFHFGGVMLVWAKEIDDKAVVDRITTLIKNPPASLQFQIKKEHLNVPRTSD